MKLALPERFAGRPRTMVWIMAVLLISLTTMVLAVLFLLRATVATGITEGIDQEAGEVAQFSTQGVDPTTGQSFTTASRFIEVYTARQSSERGELLVAGADGLPQVLQVRGRDARALEELDPASRERVLAPGTGGVLDTADVGRITYQNIPVTVGDTHGFVAVLEFHESREAEITRSVVALAILGLVTLIVTGGVVWWVAGRIGEPTERFTEAVAAYRPGMGLRVPEQGSDEYVRLARIANRMITHAESAVADEQRRVGQVAEQAATRADALVALLDGPEAAAQDPAALRGRAAAELAALRDGLDDLARITTLAADRTVTRQPGVDVRQVVADAVGSWSQRPGRPVRTDVHVLAIGDKPVIGSVEPALVEQALHEIIDNAVDASAAGGIVRVGAHRGRTASGASVVVAVHDRGRGVPEGETERVLERFAVASNDPTPGVGMGLPLAQALARKQGGSVIVEPAHDEAGTVVRIEIPLAVPAS